jgi:hypothetical protein
MGLEVWKSVAIGGLIGLGIEIDMIAVFALFGLDLFSFLI